MTTTNEKVTPMRLVLVGHDGHDSTVAWTDHGDLLQEWLDADGWTMSDRLVTALCEGADDRELLSQELDGIVKRSGRGYVFGTQLDKKCVEISDLLEQGSLESLGQLGTYQVVEYEIH